MKKLYFYLANRDKSDAKLVTILRADREVNSGLTDLNDLKLPDVWDREIRKIIYENRMTHEPKLMTATTYQEFIANLRAQGIRNPPTAGYPLLNFSEYGQVPKANTSTCTVKTTMLRKVTT